MFYRILSSNKINLIKFLPSDEPSLKHPMHCFHKIYNYISLVAISNKLMLLFHILLTSLLLFILMDFIVKLLT